MLVGVDGSDASIQALRYAAGIAAAVGAPLEAVTVWSYPPYEYVVGAWGLEAEAASALDEAIREAFGESPPEITRKVVAGPTAHTLIQESKHGSMLVLGRHGVGGVAERLLGSVTVACAERAHCPVLIVPTI